MEQTRPQVTANSILNRIWAQGTARWHSHSSMAPFSYRLGASSCSKKTSLRPAENGKTLFNNSLLDRDPSFFTSLPRHSGEDAFFMAHIAKSNRYVAFGIADGVGGWADSGVDPGEFSHGLCKYMAEKTYRPESADDLRPQKLLQHGYDLVQANQKIAAGGSTACIAAMQPNGSVEVANLGDSGFLILQPNKVAFRSPAQTHAFNTPYQLSKLTPRMRAQNAMFGRGAAISESPKDADVTNHQVTHGDVLVFATDGVWDNLSPIDTLAIITPLMEKHGYWSSSKGSTANVNTDALRPPPSDKDASKAVDSLPAELAYAVTKAAKLAGLDQRRNGPFAKEVHRYYPNENWRGGKPDDIAVIVAVAIQDRAAPADQPIKARL
ncbi:hypothetical protein AAFC00_006143 [Neodothiora populina]